MDALRSYIEGQYDSVAIDLTDAGWLARYEVPAEPGWYFIETSAPLEVLARQTLWQPRRQPLRHLSVGSARYDGSSLLAPGYVVSTEPDGIR